MHRLLTLLSLLLLSWNLRADIVTYDSLEWMTARADHIGIYKATQLRGPYMIPTHPTQSSGGCTAEFKLEKSLRGNTPETFIRARSVNKQEDLGFKEGGTYILFFVGNEPQTNTGPYIHFHSDRSDYFNMWDYIWLDRPAGVQKGVALNYQGKVLADKAEIIKTVEAALKLARPNPEINRWDYFSSPTKKAAAKDFNFRVIGFPTGHTSQNKEKMSWFNISSSHLIIPEALYEDTDANGVKLTAEKSITTAKAYLKKQKIDISKHYILAVDFGPHPRSYRGQYWAIRWQPNRGTKGQPICVQIYMNKLVEVFFIEEP